MQSPRAVLLPYRASSRRPTHSFPVWVPLHGFLVVRRIRSEGVHITPKIPLSGLRCRRAGFLTPFAAYSSFGPAGLFHPANALRLLPSGACSSQGSGACSSQVRAVLRLPGEIPLERGRAYAPASTPRAHFTALIPLRVRVTCPGVSRCARPFPSWASSPPGSALRGDASTSIDAPPVCFSPPISRDGGDCTPE